MAIDVIEDTGTAYRKFQKTGLYLFLLPVLLVALVFMIALTPIRLIDPAVNHAMHGLDVDRGVRATRVSSNLITSGTPKASSIVEAGDGTLETDVDNN